MIEIKIPETVTLGSVLCNVYSDEKHDASLDSEGWRGSFTVGLDGNYIELHTKITTPSDVSAIFLHEVIHAIDGVMQGKSLSEEQASALSCGLHQVMEQLGVRFVR